MSSLYADELSFALAISAEVAPIALDYFSKGVDVVTKDDGSPVTKADKEVEALIRKAIAKRFPEDSILGEEEGATSGSRLNSESKSEPGKNRKWIIDPIDGTYNFARGIPHLVDFIGTRGAITGGARRGCGSGYERALSCCFGRWSFQK